MLRFDNISTLGSQQTARFFQAGFNYSIQKSLQIQGYVLDLTNSFGVSGVWGGIDTISKNANDYQPLLINGVNFGSGRIENITFDAGNDVQKKNYSASLTVLDTGNLFNFGGTYYSGIDLTNSQYLQEFNENWDFQHKENGGYSSNHTSTIRFTSGVGNLNATQAAQALAITLFTGGNLGLAFYSGYSDKQGKRFFTETYNEIDNTCQFQEQFDFDVDDGNYSAVHTNTINFDEQGVITAAERGNIRGITNPNYQQALSALATEMTGAFYRCSGASSYYFPSGDLLINSPIVQGRSIDIFENNITYNISFNNKPNNSGNYFWDYTQQVEKNDNIGSITENGTIIGRGLNPTIAFSMAQNAFPSIRDGISGRMAGLFFYSFGNYSAFLNSKKEGYFPHQGQLTYGYSYSNDPTLISNTGIRKMEVTTQTSKPLYSWNRIYIFNYKEIIQDNKQSTVGNKSVSVNMLGDKSVGLSDFLMAATNEVNAEAPAGNSRYVGDASYSYDPNNNGANVKVSWLYNLPASQTLYP